jgi:hypothetical protein
VFCVVGVSRNCYYKILAPILTKLQSRKTTLQNKVRNGVVTEEVEIIKIIKIGQTRKDLYSIDRFNEYKITAYQARHWN